MTESRAATIAHQPARRAGHMLRRIRPGADEFVVGMLFQDVLGPTIVGDL